MRFISERWPAPPNLNAASLPLCLTVQLSHWFINVFYLVTAHVAYYVSANSIENCGCVLNVLEFWTLFNAAIDMTLEQTSIRPNHVNPFQ